MKRPPVSRNGIMWALRIMNLNLSWYKFNRIINIQGSIIENNEILEAT